MSDPGPRGFRAPPVRFAGHGSDPGGAPGAAVAVDVAGVSMVYPLERGAWLQALAGVSLSVPAADFCGVVGPSGCGKSTLLMLLCGLYRPSAGDVRIDGRPVAGPWPGVGMVFQRDVLLEWRTVLDNVLLPVRVKRLPVAPYRERARTLLDLVGLAGFADAYPDQLSGGMRQRVALCRSLIHGPRLLLMDEPFGAVDAMTREKLQGDLLRLVGESPATVVFVTHSIDEAVLLSDRVAVMGPRPGTILRVFAVDLPRPRGLATRTEPRFHGLVDEIRTVFHSMGLI